MKMGKRPWMPFFYADFFAAADGLSDAEGMAYLRLMRSYWENGKLPDDDQKLARIARMTPNRWCKASAAIKEFFGKDWVSERLDFELAKFSEISNQNRAKAVQRHSNSKATAKPEQSHLHIHSQSDVVGTQAREPAKPLSEKGSVSAEKQAAIALGLAFLNAAGFEDHAAAPDNWYGVTDRAALWIGNGWTERMIVAETRHETAKRGVMPVAYYEKVFATAAARAAQPTPIVNVIPAESRNVGAVDRSRSTSDAYDRLARRLERGDDIAQAQPFRVRNDMP